MARHYLVVSDLHLADVEDHADGWRAYKHSRFTFDEAFDDLVERFCAEGAADDERILVLNGDIIDFDLVSAIPQNAPWPISRSERHRGLEPTEEKSVWKLQRVLEHHPRFVATLGRFMARGHTVVYVIGNHDPELHFTAVKKTLLDRLAAGCAVSDGYFDPERFRVEPWFYYVPGEIYAEHGQQYDSYTSFRYVLAPIVEQNDPPQIALSMGNLSNRYLLTRMGYFNPHASDFILNIFRYFTHWLRYYALSRRSLVLPWIFGSIAALRRLYATKRRVLQEPPDHQALLTAMAKRTGLAAPVLETLERLKRGPISNRAYRMVRELWIDRLLLGVVMVGGTIALALGPVPLWVKLMVPLSGFPLLFLIYEWFAHGETIFSVDHEIRNRARQIAKLLPARIVTMGHTHKPEIVPLYPGAAFVNTGTWAPVTKQGKPDTLQPGLRNALVATFDGKTVHHRLDTCVDDASGEARQRA
jgi:UDP-2,3-diacylglucosamine pyrophosphatase LpxH